MQYPSRLKRLRGKMAEAGLASLLVTHLPDVRYLCGFTGSNAVIAVSAKRAVLCTDGRYTSQARAEAKAVRVVIAKKSALLEACALLVADGVESASIDAEHMTVAQMESLRASLPKELKRKFLVPATQPLVSELRLVKDDDELELLQAAATMGDLIFEQVLPFIEPDVSEIDIAARLEHAARLAGAEAMSFPTIVASGPRSALPHGTASAARVPRRGFVTLDFGVILSGYCSDMTRTIHVGKATPEERSAYEAVSEAQEAGVAATRAGVTCGDVDQACRSVLKRHKLAKYFTHSTGHGVGLEIHESPRVAKEQKTVLEPGMVITIEPGVYIPAHFGLRIEDTVVVESGAARILTKTTKAWIEL
jgi:Xaa-Pro aminopeptidase